MKDKELMQKVESIEYLIWYIGVILCLFFVTFFGQIAIIENKTFAIINFVFWVIITLKLFSLGLK